MNPNVAYSASKEDLVAPYRQAGFFPAGYPKTEGALCAEMARLAYCRENPSDPALDQGRIQTILSRLGFTNFKFFESMAHHHSTGTHCFLAMDAQNKFAVLSFRGTDADDPTDIADDLDAIRTPWEKTGNVHEGFAKALNEVRPRLDQELDIIGDDYRVLYTGHSLGAALATLQASLRPPHGLYTFGSPRVGNSTFVSTVKTVGGDSCLRRYVDCCDIVTRVPPEKPLDFVHVGDLYYIHENRTIKLNPPDNDVDADQNRARVQYVVEYAWKIGNVAVRDLADHAPINYVTAITANDLP